MLKRTMETTMKIRHGGKVKGEWICEKKEISFLLCRVYIACTNFMNCMYLYVLLSLPTIRALSLNGVVWMSLNVVECVSWNVWVLWTIYAVWAFSIIWMDSKLMKEPYIWGYASQIHIWKSTEAMKIQWEEQPKSLATPPAAQTINIKLTFKVAADNLSQ